MCVQCCYLFVDWRVCLCASYPDKPENRPVVSSAGRSQWSCCCSEKEWGRKQKRAGKGFSHSRTVRVFQSAEHTRRRRLIAKVVTLRLESRRAEWKDGISKICCNAREELSRSRGAEKSVAWNEDVFMKVKPRRTKHYRKVYNWKKKERQFDQIWGFSPAIF